jgi:hypothetical protein
LSPVAHEFPLASESGADGSELKPVVPECPSTTTAFGYLLEAGTDGAGDDADGEPEVAVAPPSLAEQLESTRAAAAGRTSHQSPAGSDEARR